MSTVRNPHFALHNLDILLADYLVKKVAWETMVPPDQDLETDCREYREASEAVNRLIAFPCSSLAEVRKKAKIILDQPWLKQEAEQEFDAFLASLSQSGSAHP